MKTSVTQIIGHRECPFTLNGVNLSELRRAQLFRIGQVLDIATPQSSKNELLTGIISKLKLVNAEQEISDFVVDNQ